jgi:hypothetical protein
MAVDGGCYVEAASHLTNSSAQRVTLALGPRDDDMYGRKNYAKEFG